ncbi:inositol hexakisphosphate-domain-containing protein [Dichomitus squalens]|uniref:Inositol hexakisphosphate-domain-containing protein n=1 Tax=Dichomitus squalens TaxID=114155 RepID=A0A4Q9MZ87_9APHY|nr:inositol hexakisphosphate-domain-containing protein [Dichomitus squalens]
MPQLQRSGPSIVKTRSGSVLSRGFILKTDHYPSGRALDLDINVHGAPNFRAPRQGNLNVYGVAQPRTQGLRAILSVLRCRPNISNPTHVVWFCTREEPIVYISGRPFVLRDASEPRRTLKLSDRAENLEAIELRLKTDILSEAAKFGGLVLTHNEIASDSGEGAILPTWTAVDANNVRTQRELMENMRKDGWNVEYHRIPISPERPIEDSYLDAYLRVIKETDPLSTALVFNCGMGAVRTTFAMVAACLVRRKQLIDRGLEDPYSARSVGSRSGMSTVSACCSCPANAKILQSLEQASAQQDMNRSLLRITYILQQLLDTKNSQSAIELLLSQPSLLEALRKAHMGNYGVILSLLGCLDHGIKSKKLVDKVIDVCDHVVNLREEIFINRVRYSLTTAVDDKERDGFLNRAVKSLEKYFFAIAFANYVEMQDDFGQTFADWLKARTEIWNQIVFLRKSHGSRLNVFAPINDLSSLSKSGADRHALLPGQQNDVVVAGGQILGDEYSDHVVKNRSGIILREGTLLKSDQWLSRSSNVPHGVRGAINFRNIPGTNIYALGQPTSEAIDEVVRRVHEAHPEATRVVWLTLREEPLVYINGAPYCLRRERFSLRNMKDYGGISASRLEVLEERLRDDVVNEVHAFGGRQALLLHTETPDGSVIPIWEEVNPDNVLVLKDVMAERKHVAEHLELSYARIPITAERPPDFSDLSELIEVMIRSNATGAPIILNCQLGRGRSTLTSVILLLIQQWLARATRLRDPSTPGPLQRTVPASFTNPTTDVFPHHSQRHSYQIINNLLRVIRKGPMVKQAVDDAIDQCSGVLNLRDSIEDARARAEQASDEQQRRQHAHKAMQNLRRYFELIIFQAYLQSTEPDTMETHESFESFVKDRPVIKTFEKELLAEDLNTLKPLERVNVQDGGVARPDEVQQVVANRSGSILSASTILKSDFFSNLQKMSLPERIEGAPNFRRVPLTLRLVSTSVPSPGADGADRFDFVTGNDNKWVCGSGMPTVDGLRRALQRVNAHPEGNNWVYWTSLREEPVIYVAGRPHVLRLIDKPLENVEATGVTTAVVETMEENLKRDVIREVRAGEGRILLHDEVEERPGVFSIIPIWEQVEDKDIMTPRDVYDLMVKDGYKVDYGRVAVTDEQAPLPGALSQLLTRVRTGLQSGHAADFVFNCQMGRGRTTSGMVTACLIATTMMWEHEREENLQTEEQANGLGQYDSIDGPSEEEAYLQGEYKVILQLVSVLSHGKLAKRLTDRAIDQMQDVQNLRKAIYDYKLKMSACEKGSAKQRKLMDIGVNYLYRYGTLIVFANYLIEIREGKTAEVNFPEWLQERREITMLLGRRSLD